MKYIIIGLLAVTVTGCASSPRVDSSLYSNKLTNQCIAQLPADMQKNRQARTRCALNATARVSLLERTYELRGPTALNRCKQQHQDKAGVNACYLEDQKKFFEMGLK
ncbi:MAG: hypothetical protein OEX03_07115 [Gammaproteobacteria bacterium]|nr:hypothetical protein [Gammaproteobacteria bacterium]